MIDSPRPDEPVSGIFVIAGWAAGAGGETEPLLALDGKAVPKVLRIARPDVLAAFPGVYGESARLGFQAVLNAGDLVPGDHVLTCEVTRQDGRKVCVARTQFKSSDQSLFYRHAYVERDGARQARKLDLLRPLLACVRCRGKLDLRLQCEGCGHSYEVRNGVPLMLGEPPRFPVDSDTFDSPASNNPYPPPICELLESVIAKGGMALDLGSGRRVFGADRLVQVEITAYPFTDVVSQGETLPFREGAFDLVFSLAVTEHVPRPWILAQEIERVTRPGGTIFVDSAFLQPIHGYPHHFFNMSDAALRSIFARVRVKSLEPAPYQHPYFSLSWILGTLLSDMPEKLRRRIEEMPVKQLMAELRRYCEGAPTALRDEPLAPEKIKELAAGFTLIGERLE